MGVKALRRHLVRHLKMPGTFQNRVGKKKKKSNLPRNLPQRGSMKKFATMVIK